MHRLILFYSEKKEGGSGQRLVGSLAKNQAAACDGYGVGVAQAVWQGQAPRDKRATAMRWQVGLWGGWVGPAAIRLGLLF